MPVQTLLPERLAKLPKYNSKRTVQQDFERVLTLFVAETTQSLIVVDHPRFRQLISIANGLLQVPNRRQLTNHMIPQIFEYINDSVVLPNIKSSDGVTLSFDLWMSRGHEDVFDIYAHFLDESFHPCHVHVTMLRCANSDGASLARKLESVIDKFCMSEKVVACVSDGGSNMRTCMNIFNESPLCNTLTGKLTFKGACLAHKLSLIFKHTLCPTLYDGLHHISLTATRARLQTV